jgi:hypothetical protein
MLLEGLNLIRDEIGLVIDQASIGSGTSQPTAQDTALESPLGISTTDLEYDYEDQFLMINARFPSTAISSTTSVSEVLFSNSSSGLPVHRGSFTAVSWQTGRDLTIRIRIYVKGRRS